MKKYFLDKIDRKILFNLDKNCRITDTLLGKKVGRSRESIKYRIRQLQNRGILTGFITSINPNKLGYTMFKVYLKLENIPKEREKFFEDLRDNRGVYWFGISDGVFDCVFAYLSNSNVSYFEEINGLLSKWKHLIVSKVLGTMVDTKQYNKKFFLDNTKGESVTFGGEVGKIDLDELDLKILDVVANNARIPIAKLCKKVNSTIEVVRTKIKQLEKKEVILNYRISVDFNKLGLEFFKAIIYLRTLSDKDEKALSEWMRTQPNSLYYIRSLAPWELEFEFVVENYQEFNKIINDLREKFPHVIRNHEHLIMSHEEWLPACLHMEN